MKRRTNGSIRSQLILNLSAMLILEILVFGFAAAYLFEKSLSTTSTGYVSQLTSQLNRVLDTYVLYMEDIASVVLKHDDVRRFIEYPAGRTDESVRMRLASFLGSIIDVRTDIVNIALVLADGRFISDNPSDRLNPVVDFQAEKWYALAGEKMGSSYVSSSHVQNIIEGEYPWVISLSRMILDPRTGEKIGTLLIDLNYKVIRELCDGIQIGKKGYVFIVNEDGEIVFHPRQDLIYNDLKHEQIDRLVRSSDGSFMTRVDGSDILYTYNTSERTRWTTIGTAYIDELFMSKRDLQFYLWLLVIFTFTIVVFLSWFLSARITKPIEVLRRSMRSVEHGNFDIEIPEESGNEVSELAGDCRIALKKIRDLMDQNIKDQELKRKNELQVLQAQINPHFLYNTLDSIIWLVESGCSDDAVRMTEELARFFRLSLSRGNEIIPIAQVIDHIASYLSIQKMRYKSKLDFRIDVDPEIGGLYSPKLLLQPLVENAIYHGLKNRDGIGHLVIAGRRNGGVVEFSVRDDGVGMTPEVLAALRKGEATESMRSGVGVKNVSERLRLTFGPEYGLEWRSSPGNGTEVIVKHPVLENGNP